MLCYLPRKFYESFIGDSLYHSPLREAGLRRLMKGKIVQILSI